MTNEEIQKKIKEHEDAIAALKKEADKKSHLWGEKYWGLLPNGIALLRANRLTDIDNHNYNALNYHKTEEKAQKYREFLLAKGRVTRKINELNAKRKKTDVMYSVFPSLGDYDWGNDFRIPLCRSTEIANEIVKDYSADLDIIFAYED